MKKHLLALSVLVLSFSFSSKSFAQDLPGGSCSGSPTGIDGGGTIDAGTTIISATPSYAKSVKRNNGNGTTPDGSAEARLKVSSACSADVVLYRITSLDGSYPVDVIMDNGAGTYVRGYFSYSLDKNVIPAKKLLFYFHDCTNGKNFAIPESN